MNWLTFSLFTLLLYATHDILLKQLSTTSNAVLSAFVINLSAAIILLIILLSGFGGAKAEMTAGVKEISIMSVAGIALGLATVTFTYAFSKGGDFSVVMPLVYIGIIAIGVLAGYLLFNEQISAKQLVGIALSCGGIYLMVRK
jgi:drug/metabolite transporter (DMT)-like permease